MSKLKVLMACTATGAAAFVASGLPLGAQTGTTPTVAIRAAAEPVPGDAPADAPADDQGRPHPHRIRHLLCSDGTLPEHFGPNLADELGISTDELATAWAAATEATKAEALAELKSRLDEKVAAGEITQAQADAFYERAQSCEPPPDGDRRRGRRGRPGPFGGDGDAPASDSAPANAVEL